MIADLILSDVMTIDDAFQHCNYAANFGRQRRVTDKSASPTYYAKLSCFSMATYM